MDDEEPEEDSDSEDDDSEDDSKEDSSEDDSEDDVKDYSNVPITLEIDFTIKKYPDDEDLSNTNIEFCKANKWHYGYETKAYPGVSCGGLSGGGCRCVSEEEAKSKMKEEIEQSKEWHKCYNRPVKTIVTLNGIKVDAQTKSLSNYF